MGRQNPGRNGTYNPQIRISPFIPQELRLRQEKLLYKGKGSDLLAFCLLIRTGQTTPKGVEQAWKTIGAVKLKTIDKFKADVKVAFHDGL
jgi:hypothetical protein